MNGTTPDQKMLVLLLRCGANPYIPDISVKHGKQLHDIISLDQEHTAQWLVLPWAAGETAMCYALRRRSNEDGHHRRADRFGDSVRSFIAARRIFFGMAHMRVPAGW